MDVGVAVVKAYLELSGYFVLTELPVVVSRHGSYVESTDLDVLAVRFPPYVGKQIKKSTEPCLYLDADEQLEAPDDAIDVVIGEVKQGHADLNPAMRRQETIAFALRRLGCCPEEQVADEARLIVQRGQRTMTMASGQRCRIQVLAFAGQGNLADHGVRTISLAHCFEFIIRRLRSARAKSPSVRFRDTVVEFLALQTRLLGPRNENEPLNRHVQMSISE